MSCFRREERVPDGGHPDGSAAAAVQFVVDGAFAYRLSSQRKFAAQAQRRKTRSGKNGEDLISDRREL